MTNKKSLRSETTRSALLEPNTVSGSALAEGEERKPGEDTAGRDTEPPRGPLPAGAVREDYVGGGDASRQRTTGRRSGRKNRLV
jgi:hypothetical protein